MSDAPGAACPNCGAIAQQRFCGDCGQDNRRALTLRGVGIDLAETLFGVEARLWRTLRELTLDPGGVVRRYLAGQRARYVSPLRYVIAATAVWWFLVFVQIRGHDLGGLPPSTRIVLVYGQALNLGMLPLVAAATLVVFWPRPYGYVQHLCLVLYVCGHVFLWRAVLAGLGALAPQWGIWLNRADAVVFLAYFAWVLFVCFRGQVRWLWARIVVALLGVNVVSTLALAALVGWLAR